MQEGLKTFGEYGLKVAAVTALGLTPASVYGEAGTAMASWAAANPEKVQAAQDFVSNFIPGDVPVQSKAGVAGAIAAKGLELYHE
ncbi:hypothetical protein [Paucidesulfovibrio longus]|uniref:hypothetical protein n=1 Tax=Paucidesulfovibrio longus TaxID=889 RepID=UPI0003B695E5|nr:hypothetical protein [Paucidesulfovibrio longus]